MPFIFNWLSHSTVQWPSCTPPHPRGPAGVGTTNAIGYEYCTRYSTGANDDIANILNTAIMQSTTTQGNGKIDLKIHVRTHVSQ